MATVLTTTQIPNDSILDINGRQTYLGNTFVLPMPGFSLTDTAAHPIAVIKNVAGSGKAFFLFNRNLVCDNNPVVVSFYLNPVLNVPGSTTTAVNVRSGSSTTSVSTCYLGASITSNGTLVSALSCSTLGSSSNVLFVIDPGTSMLVVAQQAGAGTTNVFTENVWYEI